MILADKIITLRKKNGWSQEQLAEQLDISRQSVSKWESGASIPDLDKIIKISKIFGVSTDYLLKDEMEEVAFSGTTDSFEEESKRIVSVEEANAYMNLVQKLSWRMALATFICILSPVCLILLGGFAEYGKTVMTEDMAGGIGTAVLLMLIAAGVAIFILDGMKLSKYEYLEKESISLQYGVQGIVEKKKQAFEQDYRRKIAIGVVLCILGVVPLLIAAGLNTGDLSYICCTGVLLFFIACGVYLFVWSGMIWSSYNKLLQEDDYTEEKKELNRRTAFFPGVYWCIITAVYLGISFYGNDWRRTWIIWPVAGVLFAALSGILSAIMKSRKNTGY